MTPRLAGGPCPRPAPIDLRAQRLEPAVASPTPRALHGPPGRSFDVLARRQHAGVRQLPRRLRHSRDRPAGAAVPQSRCPAMDPTGARRDAGLRASGRHARPRARLHRLRHAPAGGRHWRSTRAPGARGGADPAGPGMARAGHPAAAQGQRRDQRASPRAPIWRPSPASRSARRPRRAPGRAHGPAARQPRSLAFNIGAARGWLPPRAAGRRRSWLRLLHRRATCW